MFDIDGAATGVGELRPEGKDTELARRGEGPYKDGPHAGHVIYRR